MANQNLLDEIEIPEALEPENIEAMLNKHKKESKKGWNVRKTITACASLALVIGIGSFASILYFNRDLDKKVPVVSSYSGKRAVQTNSAFHIAADAKDIRDHLIRRSHYEDVVEAAGDIANEPTNGSAVSDNSFAQTNVQVEGIDEADIIKCDGTYYYTLVNGGRFSIIKADNGKLTLITQKYIEDADFFYLDAKAKKVLIIRSDYKSGKTTIEYYDVSDPSNLVLKDSFEQDGIYYDSRYINGILYLFTCKSSDSLLDDKELILPSVDQVQLGCADIYIPDCQCSSTLIMSSVETKNQLSALDATAVLLPYSSIYVGLDSLYFYYDAVVETEDNYSFQPLNTAFTRFDYKDGIFKETATQNIEGIVTDTFAVHEKDSNLYVLTHIYETEAETNKLTVLDSSLKELSHIDNIAPNESIYAARYLGDKVYFITYEKIDPLFVADISDPYNPKLLGSVEISGFSEYLHPYGENLLLGIGVETGETEYGSLYKSGVKLVMFDIEDPLSPKVLSSTILDSHYSMDSFFDYKAILVDGTKNIISFTSMDNEFTPTQSVFAWENNKFVCKLTYKDDDYDLLRSSYINDYFYVFHGSTFLSFDMKNSFTKVDEISLN